MECQPLASMSLESIDAHLGTCQCLCLEGPSSLLCCPLPAQSRIRAGGDGQILPVCFANGHILQTSAVCGVGPQSLRHPGRFQPRVSQMGLSHLSLSKAVLVLAWIGKTQEAGTWIRGSSEVTLSALMQILWCDFNSEAVSMAFVCSGLFCNVFCTLH